MAVSAIRALAVWWEDAFSHDSWTRDVDDIVKNTCLCLTVGLEIANDEKGIVLAAAVNTAEQRGGVWKIPRGMVRRVRVLGRLEMPEEK